MRATGVFWGLTDTAISVVFVIPVVVEPIIKGLANVLIGLYSCNSGQMMVGLRQIVVMTYCQTGHILLSIPPTLIWNLLVMPVEMLIKNEIKKPLLFDLRFLSQSSAGCLNLLKAINDKADECSQKTEWIRVTGILLGLTDAAIMALVVIPAIVESIIKGLAGVLIGLYSCNGDQMCRGLNQMVCTTYKIATFYLLDIPPRLIWNLLVIPIYMLVCPKELISCRSEDLNLRFA